MKTLDEAYAIVEALNEEAHSMAWDSWVAADEMGDSDSEEDWEKAEGMREDASNEQAEYFREEFSFLSDEDREAVEYWISADESFKDQFRDWFGRDEFDGEYGEE